MCVLNVYISLTPTLSSGFSLQSAFGKKVIFVKSVWSILIDLLNLASREYTIFPSAPLKEGGIFLKHDDQDFSVNALWIYIFYKSIILWKF